VINGQGDYSPLKHSVNVAPMSTTVIEFNANEVGDWFFHCHLLYHMKSGMARVVRYDNFTAPREVLALRYRLLKDSWYFWGQADALSNMTQGFLTLANTRHMLSAQWEMGWQCVEDPEWEGLITYDLYINRFLSAFGGIDMEGVDPFGSGELVETSRGVVGLRYLLPLNIESRAWADTDGGARFTLEKHLDLTPRLTLYGEAEYDTHDYWEGRVGLTYLLHKNVSLMGQWHSNYGFGGGFQFRF
jgi:hypothetical protein